MAEKRRRCWVGPSVSVICHTPDRPGGQSKLFFNLAGEELKAFSSLLGCLSSSGAQLKLGFQRRCVHITVPEAHGALSVPHSPSWACRARTFMVSLSGFPALTHPLVATASAFFLQPATPQALSFLRATRHVIPSARDLSFHTGF